MQEVVVGWGLRMASYRAVDQAMRWYEPSSRTGKKLRMSPGSTIRLMGGSFHGKLEFDRGRDCVTSRKTLQRFCLPGLTLVPHKLL